MLIFFHVDVFLMLLLMMMMMMMMMMVKKDSLRQSRSSPNASIGGSLLCHRLAAEAAKTQSSKWVPAASEAAPGWHS